MSGVRAAVFSKYFAAGVTVATLCCARHCNWLLSQASSDLQEHYRSVARFADQVAALEAAMMTINATHPTTATEPQRASDKGGGRS
ncbi:hypothetical protein DQ04_01951050 [Trypanosoma grayi]|uniref:hypothetical protein n=1 Tax=Trypanosoma grayi TaxID=71804 RepID=UPI0004F488D9|nr:hypothetical protein DQ04_01951050 [Trypanosoma grayi]KEG12150.1 hypothetical protein DQ04_01951050 [Trypanosoma grayi]